MNHKYSVTFDDQIECFRGMKFNWKQNDNGVSCHLHQEVFALELIKQQGLLNCNKSATANPFRRGLLFDTIPPSTLPDHIQKPLTKQYQVLMGSLKWLAIST